MVTLHKVLAKPNGTITLLLDFVDGGDLGQIIDARDPSKDDFVRLEDGDIKKFARMLMQGVSACHSRGLLHRDLKPSNLLVDGTGTLKLSDFGTARGFGSPTHQYTPNVCTRWYRPPELLMGCSQYREGADMWSAGCIVAEMFLRQPIFKTDADSDFMQMIAIIQKKGSPDADLYKRVLKRREGQCAIVFNPSPGTPMAEHVPSACQDALRLISALLDYDPDTRPSAAAALESAYLKSTEGDGGGSADTACGDYESEAAWQEWEEEMRGYGYTQEEIEEMKAGQSVATAGEHAETGAGAGAVEEGWEREVKRIFAIKRINAAASELDD